MARKVILVVALAGMLVWLYACGRSRQAQPSDTPVPTLTSLPTVAATATPLPTTPEPSPTEAATSTPEATASSEPTATPAATSTPEATATSRPSATPEETAAEAIAAVGAMTDTDNVTSTIAISSTEDVTESSEITSTTVPEPALPPSRTTPSPSRVAEFTPPSRAATTVEVSSTVEPTNTATAVPANTETITPTVEATSTTGPTASPTVEPTNTATATKTPTVTATATRPPTSTPSATSTSVPTVATRPRETIPLPTDLATSVQVTDVTLLTDLVERALPMTAELSPNGEKVAWLAPAQGRNLPNLCIATLTGDVQSCYPVRGYQGMPYRLVWSPDGEWLAFSEDPAAQALESDIWLSNATTGELTNRSDDKVSGRHAEAEGDFALDYLPMWDPSTGYLYFWRSTPNDQGKFDLDLMRLDPDSDGEVETVRSFEQSLGDGLVRFGWQRFYLQGPSAISPDGKQLVVSIAPAQEMDLSAGHKLWLIDMLDPASEPTQLATSLEWQEALPAWSNQPAVARGLQWTEDGMGIVVAALSSDLRLPLLLAYYMDVASGEVTPVVDFSDSSDREAFFKIDPTTGHAPRFHVPWTVALAPDANVLFLVTDLAGAAQILGASLPPTGDAPVPLYEYRSPGYEAWTRSSNGDGKTLVYGLVVESVPIE